MHWRGWMAVALVWTSAAGVSADGDKTITVSGCVQNFSAKGTAGTTEKGYLLTNVTSPSGGDAPSVAPAPTQTTTAGTPTGRSATPARPFSSRASLSYLLDGRGDELKNHVSHRVEVVGTLRSGGGDALKGGEAHLEVASIRLLASNCSSKQE